MEAAPCPPGYDPEVWVSLPRELRLSLLADAAGGNVAASTSSSSAARREVIEILDDDDDDEGTAPVTALKSEIGTSGTGTAGYNEDQHSSAIQEELVVDTSGGDLLKSEARGIGLDHSRKRGGHSDAEAEDDEAGPLHQRSAMPEHGSVQKGRQMFAETEGKVGVDGDKGEVEQIRKVAPTSISLTEGDKPQQSDGKANDARSTKRPRLPESEESRRAEWRHSHTQESEFMQSQRAWEAQVEFYTRPDMVVFTDEDFPHNDQSIGNIRSSSEYAPICACGIKAVEREVKKEGPNKGKRFWGCSRWKPPEGEGGTAAGCNYFVWKWQEDIQGVEWMRFGHGRNLFGAPDKRYKVVRGGFHANDIRQGGVGDCWFLSALSTMAEREDLVKKVVLSTKDGDIQRSLFGVRLFIDGMWRVYPIDGYLPIRRFAKSAKVSGRVHKADLFDLPDSQGVLAFSKAEDNQLWVPLVEKAYAKAHGSYKAISGGFICEALFDLTSFPTEVISFQHANFNSESLWARLLSFKEHRLVMGAVVPTNADGLVGCHAYSILDVHTEVPNNAVGRQTTISGYLGVHEPGGRNVTDPLPGMTEDGVLRLIRIRNPWGVNVYTGSYGNKSPEMTTALRERLERLYGRTSDETGTFWMAWHDFLRIFSQVDVCKAHRDWFIASEDLGGLHEGQWKPHRWLELRVSRPTWLYLTIAQPTRRGKGGAAGSRSYRDLSLLVLRRERATGRILFRDVEHLRLLGPCKVSHTELHLDSTDVDYLILPFSLSRFKQCSLGRKGNLGYSPFSVRVFSNFSVQVRQRPFTDERTSLVLKALHCGLQDATLISHSPYFNPVRVIPFVSGGPGSAAAVYLRVIECGGCCLVLLVNATQDLVARCRFLLHTGVAGTQATNVKDASAKEAAWHELGPRQQALIEVLVPPATGTGMSEHDGESEGHNTYSLDQQELELVHQDALGGARPPSGKGVLAPISL